MQNQRIVLHIYMTTQQTSPYYPIHLIEYSVYICTLNAGTRHYIFVIIQSASKIYEDYIILYHLGFCSITVLSKISVKINNPAHQRHPLPDRSA